MALFKRFNDVGVTVIVATHDFDIVRAWGLREIVVEDGRVRDPAAPAMEVPVMEAQR
jgi:cell division transport system ATP-binding protein